MAQRRSNEGKRERIGVSLDSVDYEYVQSVSGGSDSHRLAKIVRAARLAGLKVDEEQASPEMVRDFIDWLSTKRSQHARDLHKLLSDFLETR